MRRTAVAATIALLVTAAGCTSGGPIVEGPKGTKEHPVKLSFLAYGAPEELEAYEVLVDRYNAEHETTRIKLITADGPDTAFAALQGEKVPDVFMVSRRDLGEVTREGLNSNVDEILDSRGVDFSDNYKRDAIGAFSHDNALECMPWGVSPMVIYYNTALVDWETMKEQGLPTPTGHLHWTFDQFAAAARFASGDGTKGVYIEPSLEGIAPFVYSGGGKMYDDDREPTSLALSDEDTVDALQPLLELLRDDAVTPTPKQLRETDPLTLFKTGKLGMIAGYRSLVPELRKAPSLDFDIMGMPAIEEETTVGDVSGLCISSSTAAQGVAADFVAWAIQDDQVAEIASKGYIVPSLIQVAESDVFLQADRFPHSSYVFNRSVRNIVDPPLIEDEEGLEEAVHDQLFQMFYDRVPDIETWTEEADEKSRAVLEADPDEESDEASPSATATD